MISPVIRQIVGSYVFELPARSNLSNIVETCIKQGSLREKVQSYLQSLPERPELASIHVVDLTESTAFCTCRSKLKDHENPSFFESEIRFQIDLGTGACSVWV